MKWIAKRDFYRVSKLKDVKITEACAGAKTDLLDPKHIHRGAIFELGSSKDENELRLGNDSDRDLIAQLRYAGCIGDAADKDVVKKVEATIAIDKKREETAAKASKQVDLTSLAEALAGVLAKAAPPKPV